MKKIFAILMVLIMAAATLALAGCGGDSNGGGESGSNRETLTMATNADFPPFEFINDAGEYDGFDVHLARAIADYLDMDLVINNMAFEAVLVAVETGQADVAIAAITITPERAEAVNFTVPYFETTLVAIVMEDSDITSLDQLTEANIAVQLGTTSDVFVEDELPDANVTRLSSPPTTVLELTTGRADAIVIDLEVANQFINDHPGLRILDDPLGMESYGMAVNRDNAELLDDINRALESLKASGEYDRIWDMFFGG